jgi:hypothetical protein
VPDGGGAVWFTLLTVKVPKPIINMPGATMIYGSIFMNSGGGGVSVLFAGAGSAAIEGDDTLLICVSCKSMAIANSCVVLISICSLRLMISGRKFLARHAEKFSAANRDFVYWHWPVPWP